MTLRGLLAGIAIVASFIVSAALAVVVVSGLSGTQLGSPGPAHPQPNPVGGYAMELSTGGGDFVTISVGADGGGCERVPADADANRICLIATNLSPPIIGAEAYGALNAAPSPAFHALVWRARASADSSVCARGGLEGTLLDRCLAESQAADYVYTNGQLAIKIPIAGAVQATESAVVSR